MLDLFILGNQYTTRESVLMFIVGIIVFFVSLSVHEFAHALAAYKMGDITPKVEGRLTLNPFKHLDPMGFLCFVLFGFGWAKPVHLNPLNFKKYKTGTRIVSIVGISANILLGLLAAIIFAILIATVGVPSMAMIYVYQILSMIMVVNSALAMFNLIPIFPLDGYNFLSTFLKPNSKYAKFNERHGNNMIFIILLVSMIIQILFDFDILSWYLTLMSEYIFGPITLLGVL